MTAGRRRRALYQAALPLPFLLLATSAALAADGSVESLHRRAVSAKAAGDPAAAAKDASAVLARAPDNVEALVLAGQLAYARGDLSEAKKDFDAALRHAPDDPKALTGLGDVLAAQGDDAEAEAAYRRALAAQPGSQELNDRLARLARQAHPGYRWRLDLEFSYSRLSRQPQHDWLETFDQLSYKLDDATMIHGRVESGEEFGEYDTYIETGVDHRFDDVYAGYVYVGGTPHHQFREAVALASGGTARLFQDGGTVDAGYATFDSRISDYSSGPVKTLMPGGQLYFLDGRTWLTGRALLTNDENGLWHEGWLFRGDVVTTRWLAVYAGYEHEAETEDNITAETNAQFGGAVFTLSDRYAVRVDYLREDRMHSYLRQAVTVGLTVLF